MTSYPRELVTKVHRGLWLGGSWRRSPARSYDLVITVCHRSEAVDTPPARRVLALAMYDGPWVDEEAVTAVADAIVAASGRGLTTLVRCHAGLNRSALAVGVALARLTGDPGVDVTARLRAVRSPDVLYNRTFADYVASL